MPPVDVVIAEDSRIQSRILQKRLLEAGYEVRAAPDGAQALELIKQKAPTVIISDIEMPEMNGYELCKAVKSDPEQKVLIRGDRQALHGHVAVAVSLCKRAGVHEANIGYQLPRK